MRTINSNALAAIQAQYGLESLNIVRVWWNDVPYDYGDETNLDYDVDGRLLELSGIEDVLLLSGSTSTNVTVKLDDYDNAIKNILDYNDVHKKRVQILQWFSNSPKSDAFVLFEGQINSPIEWDEGTRTFTFSVVNLIENNELGFSFEDGLFPDIAANLIGKAWPIVFGNVLKVPALQLTESPTGILGEGFALVNHAQYQWELAELSRNLTKCNELMSLYYRAHIDIALTASFYIDRFDDDFSPPDSIDTYNSLMGASAQALQTSYDYEAQLRQFVNDIRVLSADYDEKKSYERSVVQIASQNFPRGVDMIAEINGTRFNVRIEGQQMIINGVVEDDAVLPGSVFVSASQENNIVRTHTLEKQPEKFKWFDGGSRINIINQPMHYIAAFGAVNVVGVFGKTRGITTLIPRNYYGISYSSFTNEEGFTAKCTVISFNIPLTSVKDPSGTNIWEGDDIWCDIIGEVAGNYEAIVRYAAGTFTNLDVDELSLMSVGAQTDTQPMNFMFDGRVNTLDFIKDISFQARVSVWVNERTLFFRYLPAVPTPTNSITLNDIKQDTLLISCTPTEELITKLIGKWKFDYMQPEDNRVIARLNILKYGLNEEVINYYAYNHVDLVNLSITFWSIRKGTSWKLIKFKTFIDKIQIEANDVVTVDLPMIANVPVLGVVERSVFNSDSNLIDMEIWLPVRWGEMMPYLFAYPAEVQDLYGKTGDPEFLTGSPFQDVVDNGFVNFTRAAMSVQISKYDPFRDRSLADPAAPPVDPLLGAGGLILRAPVNFDRPVGFAPANNSKINIMKEDQGLSPLTDYTAPVDIGTIVELKSGKDYYVEILPTPPTEKPVIDVRPFFQQTKPTPTGLQINGRDETPKRIVATQMDISDDYVLTPGTPVIVVKKGDKYFMQAPVWASE